MEDCRAFFRGFWLLARSGAACWTAIEHYEGGLGRALDDWMAAG
jgi:hypothetical protein